MIVKAIDLIKASAGIPRDRVRFDLDDAPASWTPVGHQGVRGDVQMRPAVGVMGVAQPSPALPSLLPGSLSALEKETMMRRMMNAQQPFKGGVQGMHLGAVEGYNFTHGAHGMEMPMLKPPHHAYYGQQQLDNRGFGMVAPPQPQMAHNYAMYGQDGWVHAPPVGGWYQRQQDFNEQLMIMQQQQQPRYHQQQNNVWLPHGQQQQHMHSGIHQQQQQNHVSDELVMALMQHAAQQQQQISPSEQQNPGRDDGGYGSPNDSTSDRGSNSSERRNLSAGGRSGSRTSVSGRGSSGSGRGSSGSSTPAVFDAKWGVGGMPMMQGVMGGVPPMGQMSMMGAATPMVGAASMVARSGYSPSSGPMAASELRILDDRKGKGKSKKRKWGECASGGNGQVEGGNRMGGGQGSSGSSSTSSTPAVYAAKWGVGGMPMMQGMMGGKPPMGLTPIGVSVGLETPISMTAASFSPRNSSASATIPVKSSESGSGQGSSGSGQGSSGSGSPGGSGSDGNWGPAEMSTMMPAGGNGMGMWAFPGGVGQFLLPQASLLSNHGFSDHSQTSVTMGTSDQGSTTSRSSGTGEGSSSKGVASRKTGSESGTSSRTGTIFPSSEDLWPQQVNMGNFGQAGFYVGSGPGMMMQTPAQDMFGAGGIGWNSGSFGGLMAMPGGGKMNVPRDPATDG